MYNAIAFLLDDVTCLRWASHVEAIFFVLLNCTASTRSRRLDGCIRAAAKRNRERGTINNVNVGPSPSDEPLVGETYG